MNRRQLLKYLLSTPLAATLDYEKLLWVPGQQIVVPDLTPGPLLTYAEIINLEMKILLPKLHSVFDSDIYFYGDLVDVKSIEIPKEYTIYNWDVNKI